MKPKFKVGERGQAKFEVIGPLIMGGSYVRFDGDNSRSTLSDSELAKARRLVKKKKKKSVANQGLEMLAEKALDIHIREFEAERDELAQAARDLAEDLKYDHSSKPESLTKHAALLRKIGAK
jgi:hypothetical protein